MGIVQEYGFVRKTAADVPEGGGEAAARLTLRPFAKEETRQPVSGLGLAAMTDQVSQDRLGLQGRRIGQQMVVAADFQRTQ